VIWPRLLANLISTIGPTSANPDHFRDPNSRSWGKPSTQHRIHIHEFLVTKYLTTLQYSNIYLLSSLTKENAQVISSISSIHFECDFIFLAIFGLLKQ
jgi:hypothetical protein